MGLEVGVRGCDIFAVDFCLWLADGALPQRRESEVSYTDTLMNPGSGMPTHS